MKRFAIPLALVLAALGPVVPAISQAESVDAQVSRLAKEGHAKYQAGDYAAAADLMLQAYELKPDPLLLFNLARAYEKANNTEQAIRYYQRYLDQEGADPKMMRQANHSLDRLRALDAAQKKADEEKRAKEDADRKAQADALAEQQRQLAEQQKKAEEQAKALEVERSRPPPPPPERPSKAPGIVLIAIGAAAAGTGAVLGSMAQSEASTEKASRNLATKTSDVGIAETRAHFADACFGVGVVAGSVGIALLIRALRAPDAPPSEAAAPAASPSAASPSASGPSAFLIPHGAGIGWSGSL